MQTINKHLKIPSKHYLEICKHLNQAKGMPRLVGGVVRDSLLGTATKDIDIATSLIPEEVMSILSKKNVKVIPTGIKFGTVTAICDKEHFEITTLRKDLSCDGRHAKVAYSDDYELDAARRDFTINALSYCPFEHKIYDYFAGLDDLNNRKVRFIGDPTKRICEDHLRILRFFRFSARFAGNNLDKESLDACILLKDKLSQLSRERIKLEIDAILPLDNMQHILEIMYQYGVLDVIFPGVQIDKNLYNLLDSHQQKINCTYVINAKYALFLKYINDLNLQQMLDFKFSKKEAKIILDLIKLEDITDQKILETTLKKIWLNNDSFGEYFLFASVINSNYNDILKLYFTLSKREKPVFPINGHMLKKQNILGKEVGQWITKLEEKWIESDFQLSRDELLQQIK